MAMHSSKAKSISGVSTTQGELGGAAVSDAHETQGEGYLYGVIPSPSQVHGTQALPPLPPHPHLQAKPVTNADDKPKCLSSWALGDLSKRHLYSTRGIRSSPFRLGPAGFACSRAPSNLTCSWISRYGGVLHRVVEWSPIFIRPSSQSSRQSTVSIGERCHCQMGLCSPDCSNVICAQHVIIVRYTREIQ